MGKTSFFSFCVEIYPMTFFCAILGSSCSLCILCVHALCGTMKTLIQYFLAIREDGGPMDKESISLASFTQLIVHKEPRVGGFEVSRV